MLTFHGIDDEMQVIFKMTLITLNLQQNLSFNQSVFGSVQHTVYGL